MKKRSASAPNGGRPASPPDRRVDERRRDRVHVVERREAEADAVGCLSSVG
jgi:hypothetical protein